MSPLVAPEEIRSVLAAPAAAVTLLDVRWQLGRTDGRERFEAGHLPGACFVDIDSALADPPGAGGRHPLPDPDRFGEAMRTCGVTGDVPVVAYDDAGGVAAARAWWLLRHHGHPDVRVLDGGWSAWLASGGPVETGPGAAAYGNFTPGPGLLPVVGAEGAARLAREGVLVDVRTAERFRGDVEPVDPVAGHVPGAVNVPATAGMVDEGERAGRFRSREELAAAYAPAMVEGAEVGAYCGSGVTAAHAVLVLELLDVRAALYAGSWSHWITDPTRPVATGG